jgi:hypothetical protein
MKEMFIGPQSSVISGQSSVSVGALFFFKHHKRSLRDGESSKDMGNDNAVTPDPFT